MKILFFLFNENCSVICCVFQLWPGRQWRNWVSAYCKVMETWFSWLTSLRKTKRRGHPFGGGCFRSCGTESLCYPPVRVITEARRCGQSTFSQVIDFPSLCWWYTWAFLIFLSTSDEGKQIKGVQPEQKMLEELSSSPLSSLSHLGPQLTLPFICQHSFVNNVKLHWNERWQQLILICSSSIWQIIYRCYSKRKSLCCEFIFNTKHTWNQSA